jgi:UDPglucose--hexose-1-phosphate uridylyltransferase
MADGRELIYFDDPSGPQRPHDAVDRRPLPPVTNSSTMRFDVLTGEWVAIAAHRMERTYMPPADLCPLCPSKPDATGPEQSEIADSAYDVVVFENRFPSFAGAGTALATEPATLIDGEQLWPQRPAVGRCEVLVFTSDHDASIASVPVSRLRTIVEAWAERTATLSALDGVGHVFPFENRGVEIGVTLQHPHGQIYGYPAPAPRLAQMLQQSARHRAATGGNLLRDVLDAERRAGTRVVFSAEHWTAYVPAAARWPVEVHLAPHRDVPDLAALNEAERDELAVVYRDLLGRLDRYHPGVDTLPYIAGWHQAPVREGRDLGRLFLQAFSVLRAPGRLKYLAGSESGAGAWVNDATPERIAERLRAVGP